MHSTISGGVSGANRIKFKPNETITATHNIDFEYVANDVPHIIWWMHGIGESAYNIHNYMFHNFAMELSNEFSLSFSLLLFLLHSRHLQNVLQITFYH